jgi:hypothetical protein
MRFDVGVRVLISISGKRWKTLLDSSVRSTNLKNTEPTEGAQAFLEGRFVEKSTKAEGSSPVDHATACRNDNGGRCLFQAKFLLRDTQRRDLL